MKSATLFYKDKLFLALEKTKFLFDYENCFM